MAVTPAQATATTDALSGLPIAGDLALAGLGSTAANPNWLYRGIQGAKLGAEGIVDLAAQAKNMPWMEAIRGAAPKWAGGTGGYTYDPFYKGAGKLPLSQMVKTGGDPLGRKVFQAATGFLPKTVARFAGPIGAAYGVGDLAYRGTSALLDATGGTERLENLGGNIYEYFNPEQTSVEEQIARDEAAGLFDVDERSVAQLQGGGYLGSIPRALGGIFPGATPTTILPEQPSPRGFGYQAAFSRDPAFDVNERSMASLAPVDRTNYERTVREPTWFPPTTSSGSAMAETAGDRNYLSDIEKWRIQNEEKQDLSVEDMQAHDVRDHIDLVYGVRMESPYAHTDTIRKTLSAAGKILPDFMRDAYLTSSMGDSLEGIQNLVEDHTKGESLVTPSHIFPRIDLGDWSRGDPVPKDEAQEDIRHMLKDVVNNTLFTAARDAEISPMEIYENDNVVFDEGKFDVLAEALLDEKAHVDQLGAALELVRDAPEDERVVESFTEQGLIDIASQVESFANIPAAPWTPQAPVIPDIVVPPPAVAPPPPVDDFSSMFPSPAPEPQVEDFSAIRDRAAEKAAERDREAEAASAKRGREAEAAAAERSRAAEAAAEQRKEAAKQRVRDKKAAAKREAADKRAADRAAAKSARMSAARQRDIAKAAKAARAAEAAREAATKKAAEDQRRKDAEAQKIWEQHKKWAAENAKKLREREANRLKQMGYKKPVTGSQFIYT